MFGTREEAEEFVRRMLEMEPDRMFSIEAIADGARRDSGVFYKSIRFLLNRIAA
jgi:hypothetical protein